MELPWLDGMVRAKRPKRVPTVLSREEALRALARMDGRPWLLASLLYGTGMRLMEALRLRVKDFDFDRGEITVRDGKGSKDRHTMLPRSLAEPLRREMERVADIHAQDLAEGFGAVWLPHALARKHPRGGARTRLAICVSLGQAFARSTRRDRTAPPFRRFNPQSVIEACLPRGRHPQAGQCAYVASFLCHASAGGGTGHPHGAGIAWPQGCGDDADLYPCTQSGRAGGGESVGSELDPRLSGGPRPLDPNPLPGGRGTKCVRRGGVRPVVRGRPARRECARRRRGVRG